MKQDMNNLLIRMCTLLLLIFVSMGAKADVKVLFGENGDDEFKGEGGTIEVSQEPDEKDETKVKVTLTVIPKDKYTISKDDIKVYAVLPASTRSTRGLEISNELALDGKDPQNLSEKRDYTVTIDSKLALWVKEAKFLNGSKDPVPTRGGLSGVYYIANNNTNAFSSSDATNNWYLVPASNGGDNTVTIDNWTWNNSEATPLVTTYQTQKDDNSLWAVLKNGSNNNYYFVHLLTGSYLTYNSGVGTSRNRRTFHMETNPTLSNNHLLNIISHSGNNFYSINPVPVSSGNKYMNPSNGNKPTYYASSTQDDKIWVGGTIGLYSKDATGDAGSKWFLEDANLSGPTIDYDSEANTFTISYNKIPVGFDILYTTDGSTPTIGGTTTTTVTTTTEQPNASETVTGTCTVKAVVARYGIILTEVAEKKVGTPDNPVITPIDDCNNMVTITAAEGIDIYYTLEGTDPDDSSTPYTEPIVLNEAKTIKAVAYWGDQHSGVVTENYSPSYTAKPTITISGTTVTISGSGTIYYTLDNSDPNDSGTRETYGGSFDLPDDSDETTIKAIAQESGKEASCVAEAIYIPVVPGYYALHASAKGYLKRNTDNVTLATDATFRYGNSFDNNGSSIWVLTSKGYLQSDYYYLNVANNNALYFSVYPVTRWSSEDISGGTKKHIYIKSGGTKLYLCNDNGIALSSSPTNYYNACPITLTEKSFSDATAADLTVQSPQQVTYLRNCYFTQKIDYSFVNDAGNTVSESDKDRRVFVTMTYKTTSDANKGSKWDFDEANGIIYNKTTNNCDATATYELLPADPFVREAHPTAVEKSIKFTLQPGYFTPVGGKNYLLFNVTNGGTDTFRYPYDQTTASQGDRVMPNKSKTALTDPATDLNQKISWLIEVDDEGFYSFKNKETGRYIYYDASDYTYTDYGVAKVGATALPSGDAAKAYKFRLYKSSNDTYGDVCSIIPYEQQFVVFKSDGVCNSIFSSFNIYRTPNAISLWKPAENASKWKIYAYEAEDRLKSDYNIQMGNTTLQNYSTSETGTYNFSATSYYSRNIVGSPVNNRDLEIYNTDGTTTYSKANVTYTWTVTDLDSYASTTDNSSGGDGKLVVSVNSMPASTVVGTVSVEAKVDKANTVSNKDLTDNKTVTFSLITSISSEVISITSLSQITSATGNYKLTADITDASSNMPDFSGDVFSGIFDGGLHSISGLHTPLFASTSGAVVKNVILKDVTISQSGNVGAITGTAGGYTRIYNCGILPSNNLFSEETSTIASTDAYCGGLVGYLGGDSRVVNCYSYATITGGTTVGGIVGYNETASDFSETSGQYTNLKTMVVNCIFYGDITVSTGSVYPVYGGSKILNTGNNGINNYNFYREEASVTPTDYNCSWPASEENLTRFEYYRYLLNSNRELCGWWVKSDQAPCILTKAQVQAIAKDGSLIAKWVLDPSIAPYPILKSAGKYPSVINPAQDKRIDPSNKTWVNRTASSNTIKTNAAPDTKGETLGTVSVTIKAGPEEGANSDSRTINITAMDIDNNDFCYGKIQLPYYNEIFGNSNGTTWSEKYGGNYTSKVVTGWDISASGGTEGTFSDDPITGYNFADRNCTAKDEHRVFAQGGFYYVPYGVTSITITAHWAKAYYLNNTGGYYDRVYFSAGNNNTASAGQPFAPAGTRSFESGAFGGQTIKNGTIADILADNNTTKESSVYDCAIVLVSNYQYRNNTNNITDKNNNRKPFTLMTVDLDFDNEPDYCFEWQFGGGAQGVTRAYIDPVRFDFLPIVELGIAMKEDNSKYLFAIGKVTPYGHFEVTETALIHMGQFEYDDKNRNVTGPVILNNGTFDQICRGSESDDDQNVNYFLLGGHVKMPSFTPGSHVRAPKKSRHCAVNVLGGEITYFYLSGNYNANPTNVGNPHCYIDGGKLDFVASGAKEQIVGNVFWVIDHAYIGEFYGGGINADKAVAGNIDITINRSKVWKKFCGGPQFGNMNNRKTVTTRATGTTFEVFYGAGNGGTCYSQFYTSDFTTANPNWETIKDNESGGMLKYIPLTYLGQSQGYHAKYELEMINSSAGTINNAVCRTYMYGAQFATTNTGTVTSTLTDCIVETDFFGGGLLGGVTGNVTSTLTSTSSGHTIVRGSVYGGGYGIADLTVDVLPKGYTAPTRNANTSVITLASYPTATTYHWTNNKTFGSTTLSTSSPAILNPNDDGINYLYTEISLDDLGTITGDATLTIKGNTEILGDVFGGGDKGVVEGSTEVNIEE